MKKSKFTDSQIMEALKRAESWTTGSFPWTSEK
jgi:hypothetical protein